MTNKFETADDRFVCAKEDWCAKELLANAIIRNQFISDILGIPLACIKGSKIDNPFLRKRARKDKQGILDVKVLLHDGTKLNIEIQLVRQEYFDKRQLFYLSKMYSEDIVKGENYEVLKKCISICILDYDYIEDERYQHKFLLRDERGILYSDQFEIHIIELQKKLYGSGAVEEWIQLLNAKTKEELDMITTKNMGIIEAIKELKRMSLSKRIRMQREERLKIIRDRHAREAYVRGEGRAEGIEEGREQGREEGIERGKEEGIALTRKIIRMHAEGSSMKEIASTCNISEQEVEKILYE